MTKGNLLPNIKELGILKASDLVLNEALKRINMEELKSFESKYKKVLMDYTSDTKLAFSSSSFDIQNLTSFQIWASELIEPNNMNMYLLLIINKMLMGDPIAYNLFEKIYSVTNPEMVLTHDKIMQNNILKDAYLNAGGASVADFAILQAEYWLTTNEATNILCLHQYHTDETDLLLSTLCE
jgi:hypothetical protein